MSSGGNDEEQSLVRSKNATNSYTREELLSIGNKPSLRLLPPGLDPNALKELEKINDGADDLALKPGWAAAKFGPMGRHVETFLRPMGPIRSRLVDDGVMQDDPPPAERPDRMVRQPSWRAETGPPFPERERQEPWNPNPATSPRPGPEPPAARRDRERRWDADKGANDWRPGTGPSGPAGAPGGAPDRWRGEKGGEREKEVDREREKGTGRERERDERERERDATGRRNRWDAADWERGKRPGDPPGDLSWSAEDEVKPARNTDRIPPHRMTAADIEAEKQMMKEQWLREKESQPSMRAPVDEFEAMFNEQQDEDDEEEEIVWDTPPGVLPPTSGLKLSFHDLAKAANAQQHDPSLPRLPPGKVVALDDLEKKFVAPDLSTVEAVSGLGGEKPTEGGPGLTPDPNASKALMAFLKKAADPVPGTSVPGAQQPMTLPPGVFKEENQFEAATRQDFIDELGDLSVRDALPSALRGETGSFLDPIVPAPSMTTKAKTNLLGNMREPGGGGGDPFGGMAGSKIPPGVLSAFGNHEPDATVKSIWATPAPIASKAQGKEGEAPAKEPPADSGHLASLFGRGSFIDGITSLQGMPNAADRNSPKPSPSPPIAAATNNMGEVVGFPGPNDSALAQLLQDLSKTTRATAGPPTSAPQGPGNNANLGGTALNEKLLMNLLKVQQEAAHGAGNAAPRPNMQGMQGMGGAGGQGMGPSGVTPQAGQKLLDLLTSAARVQQQQQEQVSQQQQQQIAMASLQRLLAAKGQPAGQVPIGVSVAQQNQQRVGVQQVVNANAALLNLQQQHQQQQQRQQMQQQLQQQQLQQQQQQLQSMQQAQLQMQQRQQLNAFAAQQRVAQQGNAGLPSFNLINQQANAVNAARAFQAAQQQAQGTLDRLQPQGQMAQLQHLAVQQQQAQQQQFNQQNIANMAAAAVANQRLLAQQGLQPSQVAALQQQQQQVALQNLQQLHLRNQQLQAAQSAQDQGLARFFNVAALQNSNMPNLPTGPVASQHPAVPLEEIERMMIAGQRR